VGGLELEDDVVKVAVSFGAGINAVFKADVVGGIVRRILLKLKC
jgi:hypothetical protein